MIRKAVGAIARYKDKFILVRKVQISNAKNGPIKIKPRWDYPKGGIKEGEDLKEALFRELEEETGSNDYKILEKFDKSLKFEFKDERLGWDGQNTIMFLVEFMGNPKELKPKDKEIDKVCLFSKDKILEKLPFKESKEFFREFVI